MTSQGWLTVITGCMCSGKTTRLINMLEDQVKQSPNDRVLVFKPTLDKRFATRELVSHDGKKYSAEPVDVKQFKQIKKQVIVDKPELVAFDEAQLFETDHLFDLVKFIITAGTDVIVAGLKSDFRNMPFGDMPRLLAVADEIIMLYAFCDLSNRPRATRTQRFTDGVPSDFDEAVIRVGGKDQYEARHISEHVVLDDPYFEKVQEMRDATRR